MNACHSGWAKHMPLCRCVGPCESSRFRLRMRFGCLNPGPPCNYFGARHQDNCEDGWSISRISGRVYRRPGRIKELMPLANWSPDGKNSLRQEPSANHLRGCPRFFLDEYLRAIMMRLECVVFRRRFDVQHLGDWNEISSSWPIAQTWHESQITLKEYIFQNHARNNQAYKFVSLGPIPMCIEVI
jgi:hypothetical protein